MGCRTSLDQPDLAIAAGKRLGEKLLERINLWPASLRPVVDAIADRRRLSVCPSASFLDLTLADSKGEPVGLERLVWPFRCSMPALRSGTTPTNRCGSRWHVNLCAFIAAILQ
jgi:hypothetical protein